MTFEFSSAVALQKPSQHCEKIIVEPKHMPKQILYLGVKKEMSEWPEMRFRKVSGQSEPCSGGKQPSKVKKKCL